MNNWLIFLILLIIVSCSNKKEKNIRYDNKDNKYWSDEVIGERDLGLFRMPSNYEINNLNFKIRRIFLGAFIKWNSLENAKIAKKYGFKFSSDNRKTGYWNFADIDCDFISLHHFPTIYKFGYNRMMDNLSVQIRYGSISREEAVKIMAAEGIFIPRDDIEKFVNFVEKDKHWFWQNIKSFRNKNIWSLDNNDIWHIRNFPIPNIDWNSL